MKLYIAGPMTGLPEFNYPAFEAARLELQRAGYEVLCPTDSEQHNDTGAPQTWDWYMRHAIRMVLDADGIALLPGWEQSRGAGVEVNLAFELGVEFIPVESWLHRAVTPDEARRFEREYALIQEQEARSE